MFNFAPDINKVFMKKFFITLAVLALGATAASAQQLSVSAGYINSSFLSSDDKTDAFNGFTVGVGATKYLNEYVGVATGLYYSFLNQSSEKGVGLGGFSASGKASTNEHYFTLPVHIAGKVDFGGFGLFAQAGPSLNLGLASSTKLTASATGLGSTETTSDNYGEDSSYGRFDVLIGGKLGIEVAGAQVFVGYNYGLLDRFKSDNYSAHRSEISAGVSFLF